MKILELKNVSKKFGKEEILKDVSFDVEKGDFCILIGHNGVGKSTILNLITQNEFHDGGEVLFLEQLVGEQSVFHNKRIGFVHEKIDYKVPLKMNKFIEIYSKEFPTWDQPFFEMMVADRGIPLHKNFVNYSRGQKMQLSLMMALARRPEVLLIDEVTSVLDIAGQKYFLSLLHEFCMNGHTVILTTNIISEAQNFCNRIVYLQYGEVHFTGTKELFLAPYIKLQVKNELLSNEYLDMKVTLSEKGSEFSYFITEKELLNDELPEGCHEVPITLEDVFLHTYRCKHYENAA